MKSEKTAKMSSGQSGGSDQPIGVAVKRKRKPQQEPDAEPRLHRAARQGDVAAVRAIISARVDAKDQFGRTPFELACQRRDLRMIRALLELGADPDQLIRIDPGMRKLPAIHAASAFASLEMVALLLEFRASTSVVWDGCLAIFPAVHNGEVEKVRLLLARDGGPSLDSVADSVSGHTALHAAARLGHVDVARVLLAAGASASVRSAYDGQTTPFQLACSGGDLGLINAFIEYLKPADRLGAVLAVTKSDFDDQQKFILMESIKNA